MKKPKQRLFSIKGLKNKYLSLSIVAVLLTISAYAQPSDERLAAPHFDTTRKLQYVNTDGFEWSGKGRFYGGLIIPKDTFKLSCQDNGAIAIKNDVLYKFKCPYWSRVAGIERIVISPDNSVLITQANDTIYFSTQTSGSASLSSYIVEYGTIEQSFDTVTFLPNIIYQTPTKRDTINTSTQYIVPPAASGTKRIDGVYVDPVTNLLDMVMGEEDSTNALMRFIPNGTILLAQINTYGSDSVVVSFVGNFQHYALVYIDPVTGLLKTDSLTYRVDPVTRRLFAPKFVSTDDNGGVALENRGGSDIRWIDGNGIGYITVLPASGDGSLIQRTGISAQHRHTQFLSGNVAISTDYFTDISSARFAINDSTKGILIPRMTGVQMNAIASPANGLLVYNVDSLAFCYHNGSAWVKLAAGGGGSTPTLQQVITAGDITADSFSVASGSNRLITFYTKNFGGPFIDGEIILRSTLQARNLTIKGEGSLTFNNPVFGGGGQGVSFDPGLSSSSSLRFPIGINKYLALSVNGNYADTLGNITIGAGSSLFPTVDTGTATGNVTGDLDGNTLNVTGGNMGIGNPTPAFPLDVAGDIFTSTKFIGNGISITNSVDDNVVSGQRNTDLGDYDNLTGIRVSGGENDNIVYYKADVRHDFLGDVNVHGNWSGGDNTASNFRWGQDQFNEADNSAVFGRSDSIIGIHSGCENCFVWGQGGTIDNAPNAVLFTTGARVTEAGSFNVVMDKIRLTSGDIILNGGTTLDGGVNILDGVLSLGSTTIRDSGWAAGNVYTATSLGNVTLRPPSVAVANITNLGTGVATWLATPSSANLASAVTNETGSSLLVFNTSPNLITPTFGTSVTGIAPLLRNADNIANFAQLGIYPSSGTNVASAFQIAPKGTGFSSTIKSQFTFCNTDVVADATNTEILLLRAAGTNGYTFNSTSAGTGTVRPIDFEFNGTAALTLKTDGTIGAGTTSPTSTLHTTSFATAYVAKSGSYTATIADNVIEVTATGQTITLPTAVGIQGRHYTIKLTASGSCTVATTSSQTIDGSTTYSLSAQYKYVTIQSNNVNWNIIANN